MRMFLGLFKTESQGQMTGAKSKKKQSIDEHSGDKRRSVGRRSSFWFHFCSKGTKLRLDLPLGSVRETCCDRKLGSQVGFASIDGVKE